MQHKQILIEIIHKAKMQGIHLSVENENLALRKSKDAVLTPEFLQTIKTHKSALIEFIKAEFDTATEKQFVKINKTAEAESYPLSNAQKRVWLASQVSEASTAYNMPNQIVLDGAYNIALFQKAVHKVIERHEILRTIFKMNAQGEIRQYVLATEALNFTINQYDCQQEIDPKVAANNIIQKDANTAFNLEKGPLVSVSLIQIAENQYIFYYNLHHIISDGWSMEVIANDVLAYYEALSKGTATIKPLEIQYKDYTIWQQEQLQSENFKAHKDYWISKLQKKNPVLKLPFQKEEIIATFAGKSIQCFISEEATQKLRNYTTEAGESLFSGIFTVWNILLHLYTGETDIILGNPVAGRDHADLQNQIGFYINTLALRNTVKSTENFKAIFKNIATDTREAYTHQMYPLDKVVEDLTALNSVGKRHLFNILIDYHGVSDTVMNTSDEIQELENTLVKFNMEIHVTEVNKGIIITLNYNENIYDAAIMKRLLQHYKIVFSEVINNTDKEIGSINYLTTSELGKIQQEAIGEIVEIPANETILTQFETQVKQTPTAIALRYKEQTLTYIELHAQSSQLANCLQQDHGIQKGDCVGVHLDREINYVVAIWGILKVGATYVPIDVAYPSLRKEYIATDANLQLLISDTNYIFDIDFFEGTVVALDVEFEAESYDTKINTSVVPTDAAYIIYTSGSTGNPKGVLISHEALNNYAVFGKKNYLKSSLTNYDFGWFSSPSFDLTITSLFLSILKGGTVHIFPETLDARSIFENYLTQGISCIKLTPSHINLLQELALENVTLEMAVVGGEALKKVHVEALLKLNPAITIYNEYGPTEATVGCMISEITKANAHEQITIGKPIQNTEIHILNTNQKTVPEGVIGELYIGGKGLATAYINRPELTEERFIQSPFKEGARLYKTGDIAAKLPSGNILYNGRKDEQVKINGYRIELQEIEHALDGIKNIQQAAVLARKNEEGTLQLVVYLKADEQFSEKEAQQQLATELPEYMIPRIYINLAEIPLTQNGKIDKDALENIDFLASNSKEYIAPETEAEKVLAEAWETVLKKEKVGKKDNFHLLGGDSIKSMHLIAYLKGKGYMLEVRDSIQFPILEDMASAIRKEEFKLNGEDFNPENEVFEKPSNAINTSNISENQRYFLRRPWDMVASPIMVIKNYDNDNFEAKLRQIISKHNSLAIRFSKDGNTIQQESISANQLAIDSKHSILNGTEDFNTVYNEAHDFLKRTFNYFDGSACIRVFIATDVQQPNQAYVRISIAHALIDIYSFSEICEAIQTTTNAKEFTVSNETFAAWQQQFLTSHVAMEQRNWWKKQLSAATIIEIPQSKSETLLEYVVLRKTITGFDYEMLKTAAESFSMPLNAVLMTAHQYLLAELNFSDSDLVLLAVNGREDSYRGLDKEAFSGVMTNFLPVQNIPFRHTSIPAYITEVYEQYINARFHQKIPYETIRNDFFKHSETDIEKGIKGYFNFSVQDKIDISQEDLASDKIAITKDKLFWNTVYGVGLVCVAYKNGIELRLVTPTELYENDAYNVQFRNFLENNLFNQFGKMV